MTQALHSQARTTDRIREEIKNSTLSQAELARRYNVTRQTTRKWQDRDSPLDGSHCPKTLHTTLTLEQELIVVVLRTTLFLPTDDLLAVVREFINPAVSRAGLGRCLRRHGLSYLSELVRQDDGAATTKKTFEDYEPGFLHIDIKVLPQMPDESARRFRVERQALEASFPDVVKREGKEQLKPFAKITDERAEEMAAKRKIIAKQYGQEVADALSGKALDSLYLQCPDESVPTANSQTMTSGAPDLGAYFAGNDEKTDYRGAPNQTEYFR